jgi:hypothetical protein
MADDNNWIDRIMPRRRSSGGNQAPGPTDYLQDQVRLMRSGAAGIQATEEARYQAGLQPAQQAYWEARNVLNQGVDTGLLFSRAADTVGAKSKSMIESLRSSLGSRNLSANSGAAQGMLSRLAMSQEGQLIGATRDIAIDDLKQRQVNAAVNFANALNLAGYTNAPASGAIFENEQNIFEGMLALKGIDAAKASADKANQTGILGSVIGGVGSVLGGLI